MNPCFARLSVLGLAFLTLPVQAAIVWQESVTAGSTAIKAAHINELRAEIEALDTQLGGAGQWSDGAGGDLYYNAGDVGIGVSNPDVDLDVLGHIKSGSGSGGVALTINDGYGNAQVTWNHVAGVPEQNGNAARITVNTDATTNSEMTFQLGENVTGGVGTALTNIMTLEASGEVGIGTTNPTDKLHVSGGQIIIDNTSYPRLIHNVSGTSYWSTGPRASDDYHIYREAGVGDVIINAGNVGIGTSDPAANLDVAGSNASGNSLLLRSGDSSTGTDSTQIRFGYNNTGNYAHSIRTRHNGGTKATNAIDFWVWDQGIDAAGTLGSKRVLTIDGSENGMVGIGTDSPATKLHLVDAGSVEVTLEADTDNATETDQPRVIFKQDGGVVVGRVGYRNNTNQLELVNQYNDALVLGANDGANLYVLGDGEIDIPGRLEVGANSNVDTNDVVEVAENFDGDGNYNLIEVGSTVTGDPTVNRSVFGVNSSITNNRGTTTNGERGYGYAVRGFTDSGNTGVKRYYNVGGSFEARNNNTAGMSQLRGTFGQVFQNATSGTVDNAYGVEGVARGRTDVNSGAIGTGRGVLGAVSPYGTDVTTAEGVYGQVYTNNNYSGNITHARGVRGYVRHDSDDGASMTHATGGYFEVSKRGTASNIANAYGVYASATGATNNWGIYSVAGDNYFADSIGVGTTNPSNKLEVAGKIEADEYCDRNGSNCVAPANIATSLDNLSDVISATGINASLFLGAQAGINDDGGNDNVGIGDKALSANTSGTGNIAVGESALSVNTTGASNVAIGASTLWKNTTGRDNVAVGYGLPDNTTGSFNVSVGSRTLEENTTANSNVAIGYNAMQFNTTGSTNTAVGVYALESNLTGTLNAAFGGSALSKSTGNYNSALGRAALGNIAAGNYNVGVGSNAGAGASGANVSENVFVGYNAGDGINTGGNGNVVIGYNAGSTLTTGQRNILIGRAVNTSTATASNQINIGDTLYGYTNDDRIGIGQRPAAGVELDVLGDIEYTGTISDVSDIRRKENVASLQDKGSMLAALAQLEGLSFTMKDDDENKTEFGLSAQAVEAVFPELVRTAEDDLGTKSLNYVGLIAPLIEAVKELNTENQALQRRVEALEAGLE